jgi:hypothetical protein
METKLSEIDEKLASLISAKECPAYEELLRNFTWTREWFENVEEVLLGLAYRGESDQPILEFIRAKVRDTDIITFNNILVTFGAEPIDNHYEIIVNRQIKGGDPGLLLFGPDKKIVDALLRDYININYVSDFRLSYCAADSVVDYLISHPSRINWENFRKNKNIRAIKYCIQNYTKYHKLPVVSDICDDEIVDELIKNPFLITYCEFAANPHPKAVEYMFSGDPSIMICSELSQNPNDRVVDYLLANPAQMADIYISMNTNPRMVDYMLANPHRIVSHVFYRRSDSQKIIKHIMSNINSISIHDLSMNPADEIVEYLLANPQYISIDAFARNDNDKAMEYILNQSGSKKIHMQVLNKCSYNMQKLRALNKLMLFPRIPHIDI